MQVSATLKNAPISAQKCRLLADMVRKDYSKMMRVSKALELLKFTEKKGALLIHKLLESVMANAEHNFGADIDDLVVSEICVNEAATLKRISPRAKGRANRICKRRCHITIKVSDEE